MLQLSARKRALLLFLGCLLAALFIAAFAATTATSEDFRASSGWVMHAHRVVDGLRATVGDIDDAEADVRGGLLTGDSRYFNHYDGSALAVTADIASLKLLTRSEPADSQPINGICPIIVERMADLAHTVSLFRSGDASAARNNEMIGPGRDLMDGIRANIGTLCRQEEHKLDMQVASERTAMGRTLADARLALALFLAVFVIAGALVLHYIALSVSAEQSRKRLAAVMDVTTDLIGLADGNRRIFYLNSAFRRFLGMASDAEEWQISTEDIHAPWSYERLEKEGSVIAHKDGIWEGETAFIRHDGREVPMSQVLIVCRNYQGAVDFVATIARDITVQKEAEERIKDYNVILEYQRDELEAANTELEALAMQDGLTGLKNHRAFQDALSREVGEANRYQQPLSLIMLDVDSFKQFNDTFGHPAGDEVLCTVARVLDQNARESDLIARYGGEEFVVILPHTDSANAMTISERIRLAIQDTEWPIQPITASFGVSTRFLDMSAGELISQADQALYAAKACGKNRVRHSALLRR